LKLLIKERIKARMHAEVESCIPPCTWLDRYRRSVEMRNVTDVSPRPPRQLVDCTDYLADEISQLMSTVYASYTGSRPIDIAI
jgi:hypothetical protein